MSGTDENKYALSAHLRKELDDWIARFPEGKQRSAVISGLRLAQHENDGYLTPAIMDAVAEYLQVGIRGFGAVGLDRNPLNSR